MNIKNAILSIIMIICAFTVEASSSSRVKQAYAYPVYTVNGATLTENMTLSGCGTIKTHMTSDITYFDDGTYSMSRSDGVTITGDWDKLRVKNNDVIYMNYNEASKGLLMQHYNIILTTSCISKHRDSEVVNIIESSIVIKRNYGIIKENTINQTSSIKSVTSMAATELRNVDGAIKVGKFKIKIIVSGTVVPVVN